MRFAPQLKFSPSECGTRRARAKRRAPAALAAYATVLASFFASVGGAAAQAPPAVGRPVDTAIDLQGAATELMQQTRDFHAFVVIIITAVTALVLALLVWVMVRYNRRANPEPRKFSHNTTVEVIWTVAPVLILIAIAIPSFPILYQQERTPKADFTVKVVGNSWYWSYEYPDYGVAFDSNLLPEAEARAANKPYLLAVNEPMVVPVGSTVQLLISSNDVIHSWAMPSFAVKQDAVPGRLNQGWFKVEKPGVFYGQCSELCGVRHAYMPIEVHAVERSRFDAWIASKGGALKVADAASPAPPSP